MSNAAPTTSLPPGQANKLAVLLDALDGVALSDGECASLAWLAGFERPTVGNVTALITRVVGTGGLVALLLTGRQPVPCDRLQRSR